MAQSRALSLSRRGLWEWFAISFSENKYHFEVFRNIPIDNQLASVYQSCETILILSYIFGRFADENRGERHLATRDYSGCAPEIVI